MTFLRFLILAAVAAASPAAAEQFVVKMKNVGPAGIMVFEPSFVQADVGDTVRFVATDPGHNAETIASMLPAGVKGSAGTVVIFPRFDGHR